MNDLIGHDFVPTDYLSSPCRICRSGVEHHQDWPDYQSTDDGTGRRVKPNRKGK